jgi:hypothetical protein
MLIEVKAKVARIIDGKTRKRMETFLVPDCELFSNAEYKVFHTLTDEQEAGTVSSSEIISLKQSLIKEICDQFEGAFTFIATLKDIWLDDDGNEKALKYKVLLWANNITEANTNVQQLAREGYDMQIEGIKQVDYEYLVPRQE